jgi:tRNA pseudouridine38-40 synthase
MWRVNLDLDGKILGQAARMLKGQHDFAAFGSPPRRGGSTLRRVLETGWTSEADEWTFNVRADAFLYRMVRRIVYIQVAAAQGRLGVESIGQALNQQAGLPSGLAPACGLTLMEVAYAPFDGLE